VTSYSEQEDLDKLKAWWKNYGNSLIFGVILGVVVLFGFRYWTHQKEQGLVDAAVLYDQMVQSLRTSNLNEAMKTGDTLIQDYASTPYAAMAALLHARVDHEAGDTVSARKNLQWVIDHARDSGAIHSARLRLARLHVNSGEMDAALALANVKDQAGFEAEYQELKGDVLSAQGHRDEARAAYREALKHVPSGSPYLPVLTMKLDDLGPEKAL
jgi:predicted negative regulator of RcsB-dependent stress response